MKNYLTPCLYFVLSALIYNTPLKAQITPPYFEDFENGPGGWTVFTTSGSSWQLGMPTFGATNTAHSGQNAWDIELNAAYQNNTQTILYSPVFDLSNATSNLMLMLWINYKTENAWDGVNLQVSVNQSSYTLLGTSNQGNNWYGGNVIALSQQQGWSGLSQGWKLAYLPVGNLAGNNIVQFRLVFGSDASISYDGFTVDDFMLYDPLAIDAALTNIIIPEFNSPAGSLKPVSVELANYGTTPMSSYDIYYSINGGPQNIQSFTQTINPGSQFVFNLSPMIVPSGPFSIEAGVVLTGDNNLLNNTSLKSCNGIANSMTMNNATNQPNTNICQIPYVFNDVLTINTTGFTSLDTIHIYANFGTGITYHYSVACNSFSSTNYSVSFTYLLPGQYSVQYIAYINNQMHADTLTLNNIVFLSGNCATVSGKVYVDGNNNCVYDAGETEVPNMMLQISAAGLNTLLTPTDQNGDYQFLVPGGYNYTVELMAIQAFGFSCPASGIISNITSLPTSGLDFALNIVQGIDLAVTGFNTSVTPGQNMTVTIIGRNNMANPATGTVSLVYDASVLVYDNASPPPTAINGDTLFWDTDTLSYFHFLFNATVEFQVIPGSLNQGDSVCFYYRIDPFAGDVDLSNNELYRCRLALAFPFDPNDKQVDKSEAIQPGEELIYLIRFQNTGTAPAINVSILDTLSNNLNRSSLHVLQASHPMDFYITPQGILKFIFNNIMLPDSNFNEPGSHGHVLFSIKAKNNLLPGTVITNRAGIIFDNQDAVITNSTYNFIPQPTGMNQPVIVNQGVSFFPSPVSDILYVRFENDSEFHIQVKNTDGRICYSSKSRSQLLAVPFYSLSSGIYMVTITTEKYSVTEKIVVSKH